MAEQKRRVAKRLNTSSVLKAGPGFWADGDGLFLRVDLKGNWRWVFVTQRGGKRREMGAWSRSPCEFSEKPVRWLTRPGRHFVRASILSLSVELPSGGR